jgi:hypothetical protein
MIEEVEKMCLQFGDIVLVKGKDWISKSIEDITHSEYSHVAIAIDSDNVCEIDVFLRLQIRPLTYQDYDVFRLNRPFSLLEQHTMMDFLNSKIYTNEGYDWLKILEMFLRYVFHKKTYFTMKNRYVCSEIVDLAFRSIDFDLVPGRIAGDVSPADISNSILLRRVEEIEKDAS